MSSHRELDATRRSVAAPAQLGDGKHWWREGAPLARRPLWWAVGGVACLIGLAAGSGLLGRNLVVIAQTQAALGAPDSALGSIAAQVGRRLPGGSGGSEDADLLRLQALAALRRGDPNWATSLLERAQVKAPEDRLVLYALGQAYAATGQSERAVAVWRIGRAELILLNEAGACLRRQDRGCAQDKALLATQVAPNSAAAFYRLGEAYGFDRPKPAAQAYRQAVALDPTPSTLRDYTAALADYLTGQYHSALGHLVSAHDRIQTDLAQARTPLYLNDVYQLTAWVALALDAGTDLEQLRRVLPFPPTSQVYSNLATYFREKKQESLAAYWQGQASRLEQQERKEQLSR